MASRSPILIVLLSLLVAATSGKQLCYSCISQGGGDDVCIKTPDKAGGKPIVDCKYKFCTVRRYEIPNTDGAISTFYRGCEDDPLPDGENDSPDLIVWAQSCTWDLCNTGDGLHKITPGGGGNDDDEVIVVPGSGTAACTVALFPYLLLGTFIMCFSSFFSSPLF